MRVTNLMLTRNALADIDRQRVRLSTAQQQASSGMRINRPSDDPSGVSAALLLRSAIDATEQFERNASRAESRVQAIESALGGATSVIVQARSIATQASNDTYDARSRANLANDVEGLFGQLLFEANTRSSSSYLFAGYASTTTPFVASGPFVDALPAPTVSFAGDSNEIEVPVLDGVTVPTTLDGRRVFMGGKGSPDAGREDLFALLGDLRNALRADDASGIRATLSRFDDAIDQLSEERSRVGAVGSRLVRAQDQLADRSVQLSLRLSDTQDADAAEVFSDLVNQENALRASLDAAGRLVQPSLLDFLS